MSHGSCIMAQIDENLSAFSSPICFSSFPVCFSLFEYTHTSHVHIHTYTHTESPSLSISHSLSYTHTHTHTRSQTQAHNIGIHTGTHVQASLKEQKSLTHSNSLNRSLSLARALSLTLSLSLSSHWSCLLATKQQRHPHKKKKNLLLNLKKSKTSLFLPVSLHHYHKIIFILKGLLFSHTSSSDPLLPFNKISTCACAFSSLLLVLIWKHFWIYLDIFTTHVYMSTYDMCKHICIHIYLCL